MANQVAFTLIADDDKARAQIEAFMKDFSGKTEKASQHVKGMGVGFDDVAKKAGAFVVGAVTGILSIQAAANLARSAIAGIIEDEKAAINAARTGEDARRKLAQIPAANAAELKARFDAMKTISAQQGVSEAQAGDFLFEMLSANVPVEQAIKEARVFQVRGGAQLATGAQALRKAFGADEAGTPMEMQSKIMAGAGFAKADIAQFSVAAARVANSQNIGATDEEALATLAVLSQVTGKTEEAATLQKAFATGAQRLSSKTGMEFKGGIVETARQIRAEGLDNLENLDSEALQGLSFILNTADEIQASTARIGAAGKEDILGKQIGMLNEASPIDQRLNLVDRLKRLKDLSFRSEEMDAILVEGAGDIAEVESDRQGDIKMVRGMKRTWAEWGKRGEIVDREGRIRNFDKPPEFGMGADSGLVFPTDGMDLMQQMVNSGQLSAGGVVPMREETQQRMREEIIEGDTKQLTEAVEKLTKTLEDTGVKLEVNSEETARNTDGAVAPPGTEAAQEF